MGAIMKLNLTDTGVVTFLPLFDVPFDLSGMPARELFLVDTVNSHHRLAPDMLLVGLSGQARSQSCWARFGARKAVSL